MKLLPHFLFLPFFALLAAPLAAAPISPQTHAIIMLLADAQGVPRSVANWLQVEESGDRNTGEWGRADARSGPDRFGSFSQGLYQISTRSQDWLVKMFYPHPAQYFDVWDPLDNAIVALGYLAWLHEHKGSWERALIYFNHGSLVDVPEATRAYARRIVEARAPK